SGARKIYRLDLRGDRAPDDWTDVATVSPSLRAVRIKTPGASPCGRFKAERRTVDTMARLSFGIPLDDDRVLLGDGSFRLFLLRPTRGESRGVGQVVNGSTIAVQLSSGFMDERGGIWFGGVTGSVYRAETFAEPLAISTVVVPEPLSEIVKIAGGAVDGG